MRKIIVLFLLYFSITIYIFAQIDTTLIGKTPPEFDIISIDDKIYQYSDFKGKIIVLNFWFPNCAPCVKEIPLLNNVVKHFENKKSDIVFLAISVEGVKEFLQKFGKRKGFLYQISYNGKEIAELFGITSYPTNIIIDKQGKVTFTSVGYRDNIKEQMIENIEKNLK